MQKHVDLLANHRVHIRRHLESVDPLAHAKIKDRGMQAPDHLDLGLGFRGIARCRNAECLPHLGENGQEHFAAQFAQVLVVDALVRQAGKDEQPDPFFAEDHRRIIEIERV
ncbi:hypothetical protein D3C72_2005790 [compost metagenome]